MNTLVLVSTVIDLVAVAALGWFVHRTGRERSRSTAEQREALERLRGELGGLLEDAERRARALEDSLAARETSLRALVRDLERVDPAGAASQKRRPAPPPPVKPLARGGSADEPGPPRLPIDPAEARLLRDLEVSLGRGRTA